MYGKVCAMNTQSLSSVLTEQHARLSQGTWRRLYTNKQACKRRTLHLDREGRSVVVSTSTLDVVLVVADVLTAVLPPCTV